MEKSEYRPVDGKDLSASRKLWAQSRNAEYIEASWDEAPTRPTRLRMVMMNRKTANWKRSTMSLQLSWNKFSLSNLLNTEDLISTNWLEIKEKPVSFKTGAFPNQADYIVNALLIKKIEKEKGFEGVWELLNVGPNEKGNEKYYQALEKLTGITKSTYNQKIWELISQEK